VVVCTIRPATPGAAAAVVLVPSWDRLARPVSLPLRMQFNTSVGAMPQLEFEQLATGAGEPGVGEETSDPHAIVVAGCAAVRRSGGVACA